MFIESDLKHFHGRKNELLTELLTALSHIKWGIMNENPHIPAKKTFSVQKY